MRIVTTTNGKETRLNKTDIKQMKSVLKWMTVLANERPMIEAYANVVASLNEVMSMFNQEVPVLTEYRIEAGETNGEQQQPAAGPDQSGDKISSADSESGAAADSQLVGG